MGVSKKYILVSFRERLIFAVLSMAAFALFLEAFAATALANEPLKAGNFSQTPPDGDFPEGWEPMTFEKIKRHTSYELVDHDGKTVVKAVSEQSSSGLIRKIEIDPEKYPVISWEWKITNIYEKGDVTSKQGDDYPARIYITFAYDPDKLGFFAKAKYEAAKLIHGEYPPHAAINYIWASKADVGTIVPNPYTDRVRMIVVQSGDQEAGKWKSQRRNLYEDYKKAFGEEPPTISGVAIMTDSDNTGESATAYYGDISFEAEQID